MFETAKEYLDRLRGGGKVWVRGYLVNTLNREGSEFWYQLREPADLNAGNKESRYFSVQGCWMAKGHTVH